LTKFFKKPSAFGEASACLPGSRFEHAGEPEVCRGDRLRA